MNDYDLYVVGANLAAVWCDPDQETLAPIRSVRNTEEYRLELVFRRNEATRRRITSKNTSIERIPLATAVQAEGPRPDVFVAGLPLQPGYKARYEIVDRWGGHDRSRVKTVTLSVVKTSIENTLLGRREIYEILIQPEDDSFQIKEKCWLILPTILCACNTRVKERPFQRVKSSHWQVALDNLSDRFLFSARSPDRMSWN